MPRPRDRTPRRAELSQHFLRSKALASSLVAQASIAPDDVVVEIGAGDGKLTEELVTRCRHLFAIELDERLCKRLRERFGGEQHVTIVHEDFLRFSMGRDGAYKVIGNIPYNRTAAIVRRLVERSETAPEDAYLVMQLEAAQRFAGTPFAPETLRSLLLKPWWQIEIIRRLRRTDFVPAPRVDSAVLWLARRTRPLVSKPATDRYGDFVRTCFGQGGATVGRCLRLAFTRHQIRRLGKDLGFELTAPASHLSFDQWLGLFRFKELEHIRAS